MLLRVLEEAPLEAMIAYYLGALYFFYLDILEEAAFFYFAIAFAPLLLAFGSDLAYFLEGGISGC